MVMSPLQTLRWSHLQETPSFVSLCRVYMCPSNMAFRAPLSVTVYRMRDGMVLAGTKLAVVLWSLWQLPTMLPLR